eukprot:6480623-Amphidinium_carterae.2
MLPVTEAKHCCRTCQHMRIKHRLRNTPRGLYSNHSLRLTPNPSIVNVELVQPIKKEGAKWCGLAVPQSQETSGCSLHFSFAFGPFGFRTEPRPGHLLHFCSAHPLISIMRHTP